MAEFALAVAAGLIVGTLSALFGIGGGILMVAFMVLVLDRGQHLAEGTSLLVIIATALVGTYGHAQRDYVAFNWAALMGIGGIVGGVIGAVIALETPGDTLRRLFAILVLISGVRLIQRGLTKKGRAPAPPGQPG